MSVTVAVREAASMFALPCGSPGKKEGKDQRTLQREFYVRGWGATVIRGFCRPRSRSSREDAAIYHEAIYRLFQDRLYTPPLRRKGAGVNVWRDTGPPTRLRVFRHLLTVQRIGDLRGLQLGW